MTSADRILKAIANNETSTVKGDPYSFSKPSGNKALGNDLGKYQVTEGELKAYAGRYLGKPITSKEFLTNPTAQDTYMTNKINMLSKQGYTPPQIADIHRRGMTNSSAPGTTTYQDPVYVNKFNQTYNQSGPQ